MTRCSQCQRPIASPLDWERLERHGDNSPTVQEVSVHGFEWTTHVGWSGGVCWVKAPNTCIRRPPGGAQPIAPRPATAKLLELAAAHRAWRRAACTTQSRAVVIVAGTSHRVGDATSCVGENHHATCPVELALQDLKAAGDALELP